MTETLLQAVLGAVLVTAAPFQKNAKTGILMMTIGILIVLSIVARTN